MNKIRIPRLTRRHLLTLFIPMLAACGGKVRLITDLSNPIDDQPSAKDQNMQEHFKTDIALVRRGSLTIGGAGYIFGPGSTSAIGYSGNASLITGGGEWHFTQSLISSAAAFNASGIILSFIWLPTVESNGPNLHLQINAFNPQLVPVTLTEALVVMLLAIKLDEAIGVQDFVGD